MTLQTEVLTSHDWENKLYDMIKTDGDWSGENGPEHTSDEALSEGFTSDFHYSLHLSETATKSWIERIEFVLERFKDAPENNHYYHDIDYIITPYDHNNTVIVSFYAG